MKYAKNTQVMALIKGMGEPSVISWRAHGQSLKSLPDFFNLRSESHACIASDYTSFVTSVD